VKRLAVLAVVTTALVSCSGTDAAAPVDDPPDPTAEVVPGADDDVPTLMAVALEQLVTEDNTFGGGPPPFTEYLIQSHLAADAGSPTAEGEEGRPLTTAEREAIEGVIRPLGPVRWIEDPADFRTDDLRPTIEGAVILGVGEPTVDGASALVPVSLWCGGLCGTWFTYRLDVVADGWQVSGTDGPIAIA